MKTPDTHRVFCVEAIDTLIAELRGLEPPFEVRISPINELATAAQRGLWAIWMKELERETGENRRELEVGFLDRYGGGRREYIGLSGTEFRPKEFAELTKDEASSVLTQVEVVAGEAGFPLSRRAGE